MVHQIFLDPMGTDFTFIYKNQFTRKTRQDAFEKSLMISNLASPPQRGEYRGLLGDLFPETYPFYYSSIFDYPYI